MSYLITALDGKYIEEASVNLILKGPGDNLFAISMGKVPFSCLHVATPLSVCVLEKSLL